MLPSVCVVIPARNEERFLPRCLGGLAKVDYPRDLLQVVVVDNGSTDRTREIAAEFGATVLQVPPKTIAHSRNEGAASSRSDIIAFVDADCVVAQQWLRAAVKHFARKRTVAVGSYPYVIPEESNRLQQTWSRLCRAATDEPRRADWLPSANMLVRRNAYETVGGFDESLETCEDSDLGYRLRRRGVIVDDSEVRSYHLREPRTWMEFFRKEYWHAKGNLSGVVRHGLALSELPSLLAPAMFAAGLLAFVLATTVGIGSPWLAFFFCALPVVGYTLRGVGKTKNLPLTAAIYTIYFAARSLALVVGIIGSIWHAGQSALGRANGLLDGGEAT